MKTVIEIIELRKSGNLFEGNFPQVGKLFVGGEIFRSPARITIECAKKNERFGENSRRKREKC